MLAVPAKITQPDTHTLCHCTGVWRPVNSQPPTQQPSPESVVTARIIFSSTPPPRYHHSAGQALSGLPQSCPSTLSGDYTPVINLTSFLLMPSFHCLLLLVSPESCLSPTPPRCKRMQFTKIHQKQITNHTETANPASHLRLAVAV